MNRKFCSGLSELVAALVNQVGKFLQSIHPLGKLVGLFGLLPLFGSVVVVALHLVMHLLQGASGVAENLSPPDPSWNGRDCRQRRQSLGRLERIVVLV